MLWSPNRLFPGLKGDTDTRVLHSVRLYIVDLYWSQNLNASQSLTFPWFVSCLYTWNKNIIGCCLNLQIESFCGANINTVNVQYDSLTPTWATVPTTGEVSRPFWSLSPSLASFLQLHYLSIRNQHEPSNCLRWRRPDGKNSPLEGRCRLCVCVCVT